jgi:drug/metabolite transporter, DME family
VIALGSMAVMRIGVAGMLATQPLDFWTMLLAGFFNAVAFLALTKSLQLIPVLYVNALSSSQAAMAAVVGILVFSERSSSTLWLGVALTIVGLFLMQRRTTQKSRAIEMASGDERRERPA